MRMSFRIVPVLVFAFAIIEIVGMVLVGSAIGGLPMLLLLIVSAVGGVVLLRHQGFWLVTRLRDDVSRGWAPVAALADATLLFLAAILLILPGFVSDAIALVLLVPPVRAGIIAAFATRVRSVVEA